MTHKGKVHTLKGESIEMFVHKLWKCRLLRGKNMYKYLKTVS